MLRTAVRTLPDGTVRQVHPFHVCVKGLEMEVLCRDSEDYDAMVKVICVAARRHNILVIIYCVVSNHCHVAVLATRQEDVALFAIDLKKIYSMWFHKRHGKSHVLHGVDVKSILLSTDWHIRNVLAYIPRNALDNGHNVHDYEWSGYRAMFCACEQEEGWPVARLSRRERAAIMHTGDSLKDVRWMLDKDDRLIPRSFCDYTFLEQAFENDQAYFLKTIGGLNAAQMQYLLEEKPYTFEHDSEFFKLAEETCLRWFNAPVAKLSADMKVRVIPFLYRTTRTSVPQLARVMSLPREQIARILEKANASRNG